MLPANREGFTVRVLRSGSALSAGVGFVVGERHIVTCAHVVNTALAREQRSQEKPGPGERIQVEFPMLGDEDGAPLRSCRVMAWAPPPSSGLSGGDVAGLVLVGEHLPEGAGPARLANPATFRDVAVDVFGYPGDPPRPRTGAWVAHRLRGMVGGGVIQLDADAASAIRAQPGYSGSPAVVSGDAGDAVVGMLAVASRDEDSRDAYAIPASRLIEAWPASLDSPYLNVPFGADAPPVSSGPEDEEKGVHPARIAVSRSVSPMRDKLTAWMVLIDGEGVGEIRSGQRHEYPVAPGTHRLQLRVKSLYGDYRSPVENVTLKDGERASFTCDASHQWASSVRSTFSFAAWKEEVAAKDSYITLERD
jgi:hypothetical protein